MASLTFSTFANEQIAQLPRDRELLSSVWNQLEQAAGDPDFFTEIPPPFPHRQDRRYFTFRAEDSNGDEWAFTVLFAELDDEMRATYFAFNRSDEYPEDEVDSDA